MNNKKRKKLSEALSLLSKAKSIIEDVKDDEEWCLGNMPENLESSERYAKMEDAVDSLADALDELNLDDLETAIRNTSDYVNDAMD